MVGDIEMADSIVSVSVSRSILPYILVGNKASFFKIKNMLDMQRRAHRLARGKTLMWFLL